MKQALVSLLHSTAPLVPFNRWQHWAKTPLFLPFYHLVSDENPAHVRHLYPVRTVQQFRDDLDFFLKYFRPVGLERVVEQCLPPKGSKTLPRSEFHLSFDDGLRECYDVVMPILLEKGIPATFFLNSAFVDNRALMFRYKASLLQASEAALPSNPLRVRYADRHLLDEWAAAAGVDFQAFLEQKQPYLTAEQIQTMQNKGFTFGGHSTDHPLYSQLTLHQQLEQTLDCLRHLKERFHLKHTVFAFPFTDDGVGLAFFTAIHQQLGEPLLTFGGAGLKQDVAPGHLQRFPMERTTLPARRVVSAEYAAYLVKKALGKDTVRRQ